MIKDPKQTELMIRQDLDQMRKARDYYFQQLETAQKEIQRLNAEIERWESQLAPDPPAKTKKSTRKSTTTEK